MFEHVLTICHRLNRKLGSSQHDLQHPNAISPRRPLGLVLGLTLFTLAFAAGCTSSLQEIRLTTAEPQFRLLIAGDASEFKDHLRNRIIAHYRDRCTIDVVNIKQLKQVRTEDFDVVLIMDTCLARTRFNPSLKAFMADLKDGRNVVLFMTSGDPDWTFSLNDIDAITSASRIENEDAVFAQIVKRIDGIIAGG